MKKAKTTISKSNASKNAARAFDKLAEHRRWLLRAEAVANQPVSAGGSPHPSVKVGAVLVDKKGREIASAANRFPRGVDRRRMERYKDGSKSLWINCAEQLAIGDALRRRADIRGAKLYVTLEPCAVCAGMIAELNLAQVCVPVGALRRYAKLKAKWKNSIEIGMIKLAEAGVTVTSVDTQREGKREKGK
jgi:tRNA(Arg) A34 adenosine deaminase TadA